MLPVKKSNYYCSDQLLKSFILCSSITLFVIGLLAISHVEFLQGVSSTENICGLLLGGFVLGAIFYCMRSPSSSAQDVEAHKKIFFIGTTKEPLSFDDKVKIDKQGTECFLKDIIVLSDLNIYLKIFISEKSYYLFKNGETFEIHAKRQLDKEVYQLSISKNRLIAEEIIS